MQDTWELSRDEESKEQDVLPIGDLKKHVWGNCWCNPRLEIENGWKTWMHNAMDKREYFEEGTESKVGVIN